MQVCSVVSSQEVSLRPIDSIIILFYLWSIISLLDEICFFFECWCNGLLYKLCPFHIYIHKYFWVQIHFKHDYCVRILFLMQWSGNPLNFMSHIRISFNGVEKMLSIQLVESTPKIVVSEQITLLRVDFHYFELGSPTNDKWSANPLNMTVLKEWISTHTFREYSSNSHSLPPYYSYRKDVLYPATPCWSEKSTRNIDCWSIIFWATRFITDFWFTSLISL